MNRKKRLTLVTMQLHTPGGIERFISTLATLLADDFDVEIVANYGRPADSLAFPLPSSVKLTFLTPTQPAEVSLKHLITSLNISQIPAELRRRHEIAATQQKVFHNFFHNHETDFIITDRAAYNSLTEKNYHGPAIKIATDHNFHQDNPHYIKDLLTSIKNFDYLVLATTELRDFYQPKTSVKCLTVPNPLPDLPIEKSSLTTKNLLSVGRLVPEKDFSLLIDAMRLVHEKDKDIHLTIIGDGIDKLPLIVQIRALGLEDAITITGWLPQHEITNYYLDSSLFVMTSKTEAFGLVLTEAMSYGLPCLALSRASGARAQITKDTGFLLDTSTPDAIAAAVLGYFATPITDRRALQDRILAAVSFTYAPATIKEAWLDLLSEPHR